MANVATADVGAKNEKSWLDRVLDTASSVLKSISGSMSDVKDIANDFQDTKRILEGGAVVSETPQSVKGVDDVLPLLALVASVVGIASMIFK